MRNCRDHKPQPIAQSANNKNRLVGPMACLATAILAASVLAQAGPAHAGIASYSAHVQSGASFDVQAAQDLLVEDKGFSPFVEGQSFANTWGDGLYTSNASWNNSSNSGPNSVTTADGSATAIGADADAGSNTGSSRMEILYNHNSFDVQLTLTTSYDAYAYAFSNTSSFGYAGASALSVVRFFNANHPNGIYLEDWYTGAFSFGTNGPSGPYEFTGTDTFLVDLTPGENDVLVQTNSSGSATVTAPVPEPGSLILHLGLGTVWLAGVWLRRRQKQASRDSLP